MQRPFSEQTVLITGGSRGIGAAIAKRFAKEGFNIILHYLNSHEAANQVARECIEMGANVITISADLSSKEALVRMKDKLDALELYPDIIINNGGISHYGMFMDITDDEWDKVMNINMKSVYIISQLFMPHMLKGKYGRIINISSVWGSSGAACEVLYSASKGAINSFTKALAKELAPSGITVNAVAPGVVDTDMMNDFNHEEKQALEQEIPLGRFAEAAEVASLVYYLALPESSYITGQIISPNGGWIT